MRRAACLLLTLAGCARSIPDPQDAVREFARACARGDVAAVHARLSREAREQRTRDELRAQLAEAGDEGKQRCQALAREPLTISASASLLYASGDSATVVIEDGAAKVAAAGALPGGGATPAAALLSFRASVLRALAGSTFGPLTEGTRARSKKRLQALADGLADPRALFVDVRGDRAKVEVEPGYVVFLQRERGLWRVERFE